MPASAGETATWSRGAITGGRRFGGTGVRALPSAAAERGHRQHGSHESWERSVMMPPSCGVWDVTRRTGHRPAGRCLARPPSAGSAALTPLRPDVQHDLAARMPARDLRQRLARLIQRQYRLDLGAEPARID